jgi:hypothetical protein
MRYCAMQYALRLRQKQRDVRWAYIQSVLTTVGNMTIAWAGIERMIDELIAWYQHARTRLEAQHPISLKNKLAYLRVMQRDEGFTDEIREFLRHARIETKRLGAERHNIIHGLLHLKSARDMVWRTQRVLYDGAYARLEHRLYSNDEIQTISREISDLGGYLSPKVWAITGGDPRLIATDKLENAKRELGMS